MHQKRAQRMVLLVHAVKHFLNAFVIPERMDHLQDAHQKLRAQSFRNGILCKQRIHPDAVIVVGAVLLCNVISQRAIAACACQKEGFKVTVVGIGPVLLSRAKGVHRKQIGSADRFNGAGLRYQKITAQRHSTAGIGTEQPLDLFICFHLCRFQLVQDLTGSKKGVAAGLGSTAAGFEGTDKRLGIFAAIFRRAAVLAVPYLREKPFVHLQMQICHFQNGADDAVQLGIGVLLRRKRSFCITAEELRAHSVQRSHGQRIVQNAQCNDIGRVCTQNILYKALRFCLSAQMV